MADEIFFTSYARLDDGKEELSAAVQELVRTVQVKLGESVKAFFDTEELENGEDWEQRLGEALRDLRVLVSMCSPAYLKSKFCAKEFAVFRERVRTAGNDVGVAILPVIWEPVPLPQTIGALHQPKDPRLPADYALTGLRKYSILAAQRDNFLLVIDTLAEDIKEAYVNSQLDPWPKQVKFTDLPDSFDNPKAERYSFRLTVLDDKGSRWKPGYDATIGKLFDDVSATMNIPWQDVPTDQTRLQQQLAAAETERSGVIFVVNSAATVKPPWSHLLATLDAAPQRNFAVLIGRKKNELPPAAEKQQEIWKLLPLSSAAGAFHDFFPLFDEKTCKEVLTLAISNLRGALVHEDEAASVEATHLRDAARQEGIEVDRIATLNGPGARQ